MQTKLSPTKSWVLIIVIFAAFETLFCLVLPIGDYKAYLDHLTFLKNNFNPYMVPYGYTKYPAGYFLFMGFLGYLSVDNYIELKFVFSLFDLASILMINKIMKDFFNLSDIKRISAILIYFFFPHHIISMGIGENDIVGLFFILCSLYFFLKTHYYLSSLCLGFGVNFKIFPILFLIPASIYFIHEAKYKQGILYWLIQGISFVAISSPYLFRTPIEYIKALSVNMSRSADGLTFRTFVPFLYAKIFSNELFSISFMFIVQIAFLAALFLFLHKFSNLNNQIELIINGVITFSIYPVLMNQINYPKFMVIFALMIVPFAVLKSDEPTLSIKSILLVALLYSYLFITLYFPLTYDITSTSIFLIEDYQVSKQIFKTAIVFLLFYNKIAESFGVYIPKKYYLLNSLLYLPLQASENLIFSVLIYLSLISGLIYLIIIFYNAICPAFLEYTKPHFQKLIDNFHYLYFYLISGESIGKKKMLLVYAKNRLTEKKIQSLIKRLIKHSKTQKTVESQWWISSGVE